MMTPKIIAVLPKTTLGEGPLWANEMLHYVDIVQGKIHRHDFLNDNHNVIETGGPVGFAVLDKNSRVIAGIQTGEIYRMDFESTKRELLIRPARDITQNFANDGKCDRVGRLWAGTKNRDEKASDTGSLSRYDSGDRMKEVLYPVHISNGIAWSPDNKKMYYNDSGKVIWEMDYDLASGNTGARRVFANMPKDGSVPDGMTVDTKGNLYCAMWGGARVDVYTPDGKIAEVIHVPTALQTSSVAFGGPNMSTLFITSAQVDLTPVQKQQYPDSGSIFAVRRNIPGIAEAPFDNDRFSPK